MGALKTPREIRLENYLKKQYDAMSFTPYEFEKEMKEIEEVLREDIIDIKEVKSYNKLNEIV